MLSSDVRFVDIAPRRVLAVDGDGAPGADQFQAAIAALYSVGYALHFRLKQRGLTVRIGALEGLWWLPGELDPGTFQPSPRELAKRPWTLLLEIPSQATEDDLRETIVAAIRKRPAIAAARVHVMTLDEGDSAEIVHVGPYVAERPTIERLHEAIAGAGLVARGRHHEIYLGDPRRSAPERLRTLIRQPVARAA